MATGCARAATRHNWSPLTVAAGHDRADRVLLVDTTATLTAITVSDGPPASVTAQAGASMEAILSRPRGARYGLNHNPAPGDLTIGGVLAIDGHGTAVPPTGETRTPGHTFGSVSNLVAVDHRRRMGRGDRAPTRCAPSSRTDPEIGALMAHVGRAFVTEVTLLAEPNARVRCQSFLDIAATEMFAAPGSTGRTIDRYLAQSGRVEAIWFPFTANPWLKVWTKTPEQAVRSSREVDRPYNYTFSDNLPPSMTDLIAQIQTGAPRLAPTLGKMQWTTVGAGLSATITWDIWGWSKNTSLYVRPTTLRVTANGYAIRASRADVQRVIHEFTELYQLEGRRLPRARPLPDERAGRDPGDRARQARRRRYQRAPGSSNCRRRGHGPTTPSGTARVWLDILTLPGTP